MITAHETMSQGTMCERLSLINAVATAAKPLDTPCVIESFTAVVIMLLNVIRLFLLQLPAAQ